MPLLHEGHFRALDQADYRGFAPGTNSLNLLPRADDRNERCALLKVMNRAWSTKGRNMIRLSSASEAAWKDGLSNEDRLPIRKSGEWAAEKHQHLAYYGKMFATGMKNTFKNRVYIELFAGPGRCRFPDDKESPGSPLQMMDLDLTKFAFIEKNVHAAEALDARIASGPKANCAHVFGGDWAVERICLGWNC
jgi:hypothetical protein